MMRELGGGTVEHNGLEQWTSHLNRHQIHLEGLVNHGLLGPIPSGRSQGGA